MNPVILQPGQQVCGELGGIFRILEWVGEGSYARVYRTVDSTGLVALKLAKREVSGATERLLREKAAHVVLKHPAIPSFVDAEFTAADDGCAAGPVWLARRWVEGNTLTHFLTSGRGLPLVHAVALLYRIADALAAIHLAGWTHGDVRPDNILLQAGTNRAYLLDLGEAQPYAGAVERSAEPARGVRRSLPRVIRPQPASHPGAGPCIAGPTACSPAGLASPGRDLQQLGMLLAWCLTGEDPHLHPDRLSASAGFHPVVVQLWQDTRSGSLTSAAAFRDALERLSRQLGTTLSLRRSQD